ncbi:MAG: hypothetical protein PHH58_15860 [Rhodoferax sp.]|nr:hypothetical protein [Rhodoferax sp.]
MQLVHRFMAVGVDGQHGATVNQAMGGLRQTAWRLRMARQVSSSTLALSTNMTRWLSRIFLCTFWTLGLPFTSQAEVPEKCVSTIAELKALVADQPLALKWEETTMDDAKPLVVSISESNGALSVAFVKTTKGLWADISGTICQADKSLEIRFSAEQIRFGPAASWLLRYALGGGGKFTLTRLADKQMQVQSTGWSGIFVPVPCHSQWAGSRQHFSNQPCTLSSCNTFPQCDF